MLPIARAQDGVAAGGHGWREQHEHSRHTAGSAAAGASRRRDEMSHWRAVQVMTPQRPGMQGRAF